MIPLSEIENILKEAKIKYSHSQVTCYDRNFRGAAEDMFVFKYKDRRFHMRIYDEDISIETNTKVSVAFAINIPDKVGSIDIKYCSLSKTKIYISSYRLFDKILLEDIRKCIELIKDYLQRFDFQRSFLFGANGGLFVFCNCVELALRESSEIFPAIDILLEMLPVIEENFPDKPDDIDANAIPEELRDLIPLLNEWAISDDQEREEKVDETSEETLTHLANLVTPKLDAINRYLDSFGDEPLSEEATMFASLAELVCELQLRQ